MLIGHCVATIPTNFKVITTAVCCNVCCNKSLRIQLLYWPVGHCRAGRQRRRRRQNPAAAFHDALVVVAPPPAPRRAPTCCPLRPPILSTRLLTRRSAALHPDARSRRFSTHCSPCRQSRACALAVARASASSAPETTLPADAV
ncbi:hypothetical protein K523DRAFT_408516, partial [Schizophyllum commune Tattone D]